MSECCSRLSSHRGDRTDGSGDLGAGDYVEGFSEMAAKKQIVVALVLNVDLSFILASSLLHPMNIKKKTRRIND